MERVVQTDGQVQELTSEEGRALFDRQARRYLKISGDEFVRGWDSGKFDPDSSPGVMRVAMLLPLVR